MRTMHIWQKASGPRSLSHSDERRWGVAFLNNKLSFLNSGKFEYTFSKIKVMVCEISFKESSKAI